MSIWALQTFSQTRTTGPMWSMYDVKDQSSLRPWISSVITFQVIP